ncbi:hypothetical protein CNX70_22675 [Janthinobacterium svalbardensis]|uniref:Uncharacterized protein n=1 Tax=Janthinobacterium svalbardensis TaxID=368607 RepID=A0A290X0E9_9BURK|nr:hypothetical protein CNX70_22675 [Janthinobacterium svalbardensis]
MPAGLWVVLCAFKAAPGGRAWLQGRHFTAFGRRGGVLRADVKKPRRQGVAWEYFVRRRDEYHVALLGRAGLACGQQAAGRTFRFGWGRTVEMTPRKFAYPIRCYRLWERSVQVY